jgi:gliding motility-associated-like protein
LSFFKIHLLSSIALSTFETYKFIRELHFMKNLSLLLRYFIVILLLLSGVASKASHIVGVDLFYSYVSGNTYKITLVAYGDCAGAAFSTLPSGYPTICIYNGNVSYSSLTLAIQAPTAGVEITPVCPADAALTQCTSLSYTIPGIKKFIYTGTYTLPYASSTWRFIFTGDMGSSSAGRGTTITNIASGTIVQLVDTLNNSLSYNNNAEFTILPTPFFCLDQPNDYNPGALDPDGDSLAISLVSGMNGSGVCGTIGGAISYVSPYTPTAPLGTTAFTFNGSTGQIDFTPNITQRALVVYNVEEYRAPTHYLIGTCQREMTFTVLTCTDVAPSGGFSGPTAGTVTDSTNFSICDNEGAFSVHITPTETDTSNTIEVTGSGLPTGATFTTVNNGTNHPISTFTWNTTGVAPGTYTFYVTFQDDACPLSGIQTKAFTVTVLAPPTVLTGPGATICQGASATLTASGAISYNWSPTTGLSCITCSSTVASPASSTLYTVTGTATNGCTDSDTARITIKPLPPVSAGPATSICVGSSTTLSASGAVSYTWSPGATLSCTTCTNPVADPAVSTVYTLTGTGANGCTNTGTIDLTIDPLPVITAPAASMCFGSSVTLSPSGGVSYTWSPTTALSCTACTNPVSSATVTTTYLITGTNVNGCVNTGTVTVTVSNLPTPPAVVSPVTYCMGAAATPLSATGGSLLWYTTATGGTSSTVAPTPSTTMAGTTKYYVSQTVTGCESNRDSIAVIVNPLPVITIAPALPAICAGGDTTVTASGGTSYTWGPATGLGTVTGASVTASPPATTTYTVTGVGADGCTNSDTVTVTVNPLPTISITPSSAVICPGGSTDLTATGAVSYTWLPAATLSASVGPGVTASPTVTATYTITGIDANNCVNNTTATVTVTPIPLAPSVVSPVSYCQNATAAALTAGGAALLWYTTATGGTGAAIAPTPPTATAGTTTYYVSQTVGCEGPRDSITVIIKPLPAISITPLSATICAGKDTTLGAGGGVTYAWLPATGLSASTGASVTAHPAITTIYTVTGTGANGCTDTATRTVMVNPLPTIVITPPAPTICNGSSSSLTASGAATYTWSPSSTLTSSVGASVTADPAATITYSITGTDVNNCVGSGTVIVTVNPIPPAPTVVTPVKYCMNTTAAALTATGAALLWYTTATGGTGATTAPVPSTTTPGTTTYYVSQTVGGCESPRRPLSVTILPLPTVSCTPPTDAFCAGYNVSLTASGAITYSWAPIAGLTTATGASITATPPVTTVYTVTGTDANNCSNTAISTITVHPLPTIIISPAAPAICIGSDVTLTASGAVSYLWGPSATLSSNSGATVVATPANTTAYTISGTDGFGCVNTTVITVTVNPIPPAPSVISPVIYCQDAPAVALTATGLSLLWYTTRTGGTGDATAPIPPTTTLGSTTWYVSQTVNGCESPTAPITVDVIRNAITDFSLSIKYGCYIDTVQFTNTSQYAINYAWYFGDNGTAAADTDTNPVHYYTAVQSPTVYKAILHGNSAACYGDSTIENVTLYPTPPITVTVTADQVLIYGDTLTLNADGAQTYFWSPDNGTLSNPNINNPLAYPFENITYTVYGFDGNGCKDSAQVNITVIYENNPVVPNAFTPNNDGKDDVFGIINMKGSKLLSFRIYNRWGQEVFSTTDATQGWDGTFNGVPQGLGVFDYLIITSLPNGATRTFKGDVTLIR